MSEITKKTFRDRFAVFVAFIKSKSFFKHLTIAIIISLGILFFVLQSLEFVTHHGDSQSVPDFTGLTLKKANKLARQNNLRLKIIDSVDNAPGKRGTVIAQTPPPNFKVKEGRTIHITLKRFNPKKIEMPDFRGISLVQAKADIETYGLRIGKLKYVPDIATNNVLEQMYNGRPIDPGTPIEKNSTIDLILGLGSDGRIVIVPDLIGIIKSEAIQKTTDNSLNIGKLIYDETVNSTADTLSAIIYKQSPSKNVQAVIGSTVDLWFTLDDEKIKAIREEKEQ